ncbi:MAG: NAD-dependent epimerase/dehydratase family protein [Acidisphaera sp.]|nr:NAD-dependent epimerase/dehydratase family protein [Acidisphaera sp.]
MPGGARAKTARRLTGARCLVLGAGGFIGTNLCGKLIAEGAEVRAFGRSRQFPEPLTGVEWIRGSLGGYQDFAGLVGDRDFVFDLIGSGLPDSSNRNPAADVTRSILSTIELLEACREKPVRRIVFASSGGTVYGISRLTPIPESAPTEPISAYGIGKLAVEKYLGLYRHLYGLDYTALRIANPYGPFQTAHRQQGVIAAFVQQALDGRTLEIWGDGTVVRDFIHIDDVTEAMVEVLAYAGPHHVFNVGSGIGRSVNAIVADIQAVLGRGALRRSYRSARPADVPVNVLDIGLIRSETGWAPATEWLDGLRGTVDWLAAASAA